MTRRSFAVLVLVVGACDDSGGFPDARPPDATPSTGTFSLSWTLTDTTDAMPVTCDDANAVTVSITVVEEGAGSGFVEIFNCTSTQGTSRPIRAGTYRLTFSLRGPGGEIATAAPATGVVVRANQDTPIGARDFAFDATGGLSVRIATPAMTNCGPIATMGGAIDTMAITLTKGGACVPVDWTIAAAPYSATCPQPPARACIEKDVDVVATGLAAGRYQLAAVGNIAAAACWLGAQEIRVPTAGATATTMLGLTYQPAVLGCPPMP